MYYWGEQIFTIHLKDYYEGGSVQMMHSNGVLGRVDILIRGNRLVALDSSFECCFNLAIFLPT